jgi:iron complex outermembrane receptor protein
MSPAIREAHGPRQARPSAARTACAPSCASIPASMNGFSAYLSGPYVEQDLFVNQGAWNCRPASSSTARRSTASSKAARSRPLPTSRAPTRPTTPICRRTCSTASAGIGRLCAQLEGAISASPPARPPRRSSARRARAAEECRRDLHQRPDPAQRRPLLSLRRFRPHQDLSVHVRCYHHKDKGAGNNWIAGLSNQGTASTADDLPVQIRDTRYTIDRTGVLGSSTGSSASTSSRPASGSRTTPAAPRAISGPTSPARSAWRSS